MAKIVSKPVHISIRAPSRFANGSDPGSFSNDLWTPGRDSNGMINNNSWNLVPSGRWVNVASTQLAALESLITARFPGWRDYGSTKWNGVTDAWNGVAIDELGNRAWWVCAGGHGNSSNNGIYRFDAFKMKYSIECMPSDTNLWSEAYKNTGTFAGCPESSAAMQVKLQNGTLGLINDIYSDEIFWDHKPTSRHVYSGVVYLPTTNELIMGVRRFWRYSLTSGQWTYKRYPADAFNWSNTLLGEENIAHFDQVSNQILIASCGSPGPNGNIYDLNGERWLNVNPPGTSWDYNGAADYRSGDVVTLFCYPENPTSNYANPGRYLSYNITTRQTLASGVVQCSGGLSPTQFPAGEDGVGMVYVPPLNRYWTVIKSSDGSAKWCEIDPTTNPWTLKPLTHLGAIPSLSGGNTIVRRRMVWMPGLRAVVFLGSADKNISLYKIP